MKAERRLEATRFSNDPLVDLDLALKLVCRVLH